MKNMDLSFILEKDTYPQFLSSVFGHNINTNKSYFCTADMRNFCRFFYVTGGTFCITPTGGKEIKAQQYDIIFLPSGIAYTSRWEGENCGYYCLNFHLLENFVPMEFTKDISLVENDKKGTHLSLFQELHKVWSEGKFGYNLQCNALFFELLKYLCLTNLENKVSRRCRPIADGILYLENNYTKDITTAELAQMCHMSASNFRRLFQHYSDHPPITYRNMLRIRKAAQLLKTNDFSVQEVAEAVNMPDLYYFSKTFKAFMGVSPKKYE